MQTRRVALIRGINVGKAKRIAMADLRGVVESVGYTNVQTWLNSGNIVFTSTGRRAAEDARTLEAAVATLGVVARVVVIDGAELIEAVGHNPFSSCADQPSRLLMLVLHDETSASMLAPLLSEDWTPEAIAVHGRFVYLWCAKGILSGRLWSTVDRLSKDNGTARNLATMTKLCALVSAP